MLILRNGNVTCRSPCPLLNFRNSHVLCHYLCGLHVAVTEVNVALSDLRCSHVALSILGVKGHKARTIRTNTSTNTNDNLINLQNYSQIKSYEVGFS